MSDSKGDQRALIEALDRFTDKADKVLSLNSGNTTSSIQVNAGGVGVWICVCLCCMMLVSMAMGAVWMSREFNRYDSDLSERKAESDRAQTYLSSIYGRMPQWMREEVEKEASAKLKEKEKSNADTR